MIVVSNTSPLIYLGKIGKFSFLRDLYSRIFIPIEVWNELIQPILGKKDKLPSDVKLELEARDAGWLIVKNPEREDYLEIALNLSRDLGRGEAYAIALSLEINADVLLINDKNAKDIAESMGIKTKWISQILLDAAIKHLIIDYKEFTFLLQEIIEEGLWIEKHHFNNILTKAKEIFKDRI